MPKKEAVTLEVPVVRSAGGDVCCRNEQGETCAGFMILSTDRWGEDLLCRFGCSVAFMYNANWDDTPADPRPVAPVACLGGCAVINALDTSKEA